MLYIFFSFFYFFKSNLLILKYTISKDSIHSYVKLKKNCALVCILPATGKITDMVDCTNINLCRTHNPLPHK